MKKIGKFVYWTPRILSILFILFLAMFSLDVIEPGRSIGQILIGLFMHNIPVFILAGVIWISWKREIVGAIGFTIGGLLYCYRVLMTVATSGFEWFYLIWALQIAGVAFFIAALYFMNWKRKRATMVK